MALRTPLTFRALLAPSVLVLVLAAVHPAASQTIAIQAKQVTLQAVAEQLSAQTGYLFRVDAGEAVEKARHDVSWRDLTLAQAIAELEKTYKCDVFNLRSGFFIVAAKPPAPTVPVGPYRAQGVISEDPDEPGTLELLLTFHSPDELRVERIASLSPDLRITDNFRRSLLPPSSDYAARLRSPRNRLLEYTRRLVLYPRDGRVARVRTLAGSVTLFKKITPVQIELPLGEAPPRQEEQHGVTIRLDSFDRNGTTVRVATRLFWKNNLDVVGRGLLRTPSPYLVDAEGRVYRDTVIRPTNSLNPASLTGLEQHFEFGRVQAPPVRLVYELYVREDPSEMLPFHLSNIPIPRDDENRPQAELGNLYAADGGTVTTQVLDRAGKSLEGELSLGLSRKVGATWSAWRWVEVATEPDGKVRITHLAPGTYRISRKFRLDPSQVPIAGPAEAVTVLVTTKGQVVVPALKLGIEVPPER